MKLKYIFSPAIKLMNKLNFSYKFALISALFAVPLIFSLIFVFIGIKNDIQYLKQQQQGIQQIIKVQEIIFFGEELRDLNLINALEFNTPQLLNEKIVNIRKKIVNKYEEILLSPLFEGGIYESVLIRSKQKMLKTIQKNSLEISDLQGKYYESSQGINLLFKLETQISIDTKLVYDSAPLSSVLVKVFPKFTQELFETTGMLRGFGSYYLIQGYLNSPDINLLTLIQSNINNNANQLTELHMAFSRFLSRQEIKRMDLRAILNELSRLQTLLSDNILSPESMTMNWIEYFKQASYSINEIKAFEKMALTIVDKNYSNRIDNKKSLLIIYLIVSMVIATTFIYLFIGFYISINKSLYTLLEGASSLKKGSNDFKITLRTKDEFKEIALAFNKAGIDLKHRENELKELSITDELTRIKNRKYFNSTFNEHLVELKRTNKPISLLMMDIDFFKKINDKYGHLIGDKCLIHVAHILQETLSRESDVLARFGGEEFVVILPYTDSHGAQKVAETLTKSIRESPYVEKNVTIHITISTGISSINNAHKDKISSELAEIMLHEADIALYRAKEGGRNQWVEYKK